MSCSLGREPQDLGGLAPQSPSGATSPHASRCAGGPRRARDIAPPGLERLRTSGPWGLRPRLHDLAAPRLGVRQAKRA